MIALNTNDAISELLSTIQTLQQTVQGMRYDLQATKQELNSLQREHNELKEEVNSSNKELDWVDKRTFVLALGEFGLMDAARVNSPATSADNFRYLSRLMREWDIFATHDGPQEPTHSKQVWKLSSKKVLFHKVRAIERFRQFTRMRSSFSRADKD